LEFPFNTKNRLSEPYEITISYTPERSEDFQIVYGLEKIRLPRSIRPDDRDSDIGEFTFQMFKVAIIA
tara:strand:- start:897 stop:1100 length:204 start_codon:yes stop_codon:yes gene_type:complete